jgi:Tol biopolymer transport system component
MDGQEFPASGGIRAEAYPQGKSKNIILYEVADKKYSVILFSPDSKLYAYWGLAENNKAAWVVNGIESQPYYSVTFFQFSEDSKHYSYIANEDKSKNWLIFDGEKRLLNDNASLLSISPDGKRIAYVYSISDGSKKKSQSYKIVIDGNVDQNNYDQLYSPEFSPQGDHVLYANRMNNIVSIVVDGISKAIDGELLTAPKFDSNNTFQYIIFKSFKRNHVELTFVDEAIGGVVK